MERVTDNDFSNLEKNMVFLENCNVAFKNSYIEFHGENNIIYFSGGIKNTPDDILLESTRITCKGDNNLVFITASKFPVKIVSTLGHGCTIYIGKNLWCTTPAYLMANEASWIHIGNWNLIARNVWMRTSDMHMIYDIESGIRINPNRNIFIGDHVWLGQDVTCLKGTIIGHGSCIGLGSLCTGEKTKSVNSIYAGRPAVFMRGGITWRHKGTNQVSESELETHKFDKLNDRKYVYTDAEMENSIAHFSREISRSDNIQKRLNFLKQYARHI